MPHLQNRFAGCTNELAEFTASATPDLFPKNAVSLAKEHILDTLAVAVAGANTDVGRIMTANAMRQGGSPEASVIGVSGKTCAETAALTNATLAHAHDFDDDCVITVSHPGAAIIPAVFALAEAAGASGRDVIEALVLGLETMRRVSDAINIQHYLDGWHCTATLGVLGAATGCARILKLDPTRTRNALAIAGSLASGGVVDFGTGTKPLNAGHAAQGGVMAARLAADGLTGHAEMLERSRVGFFSRYSSGEPKPRRSWKPLGAPLHIVDPGVNFKQYPCCAGMHATIECAVHLARRHDIDPQEVRTAETVVEQMLIDNLSYATPRTPAEARFSLAFALAVGICCRKAGIAQFSPQTVTDPRLQALVRRCRTAAKAGPPCGTYPTDAQVRIVMRDGCVYEHATAASAGHAVLKPFSREDLAEKTKGCYRFSFPAADSSALVQTVLDDFEHLADVGEAARLLPTRALPGRA